MAEAVVNTAVGYIISVAATAVVLPMFGLHPTGGQSTGIAAIFTAISVARNYAVRRWFAKS